MLEDKTTLPQNPFTGLSLGDLLSSRPRYFDYPSDGDNPPKGPARYTAVLDYEPESAPLSSNWVVVRTVWNDSKGRYSLYDGFPSGWPYTRLKNVDYGKQRAEWRAAFKQALMHDIQTCSAVNAVGRGIAAVKSHFHL